MPLIHPPSLEPDTWRGAASGAARLLDCRITIPPPEIHRGCRATRQQPVRLERVDSAPRRRLAGSPGRHGSRRRQKLRRRYERWMRTKARELKPDEKEGGGRGRQRGNVEG